MTYIVEIFIIILCCGGCVMFYAECCECEPAIDTTNDELNLSPVTTPIQHDKSCHIEI